MAFVRVRLENGSEASVSAEFAELHGLELLDKPATYGGRPLPTEHPDPAERPDPPAEHPVHRPALPPTNHESTARAGAESTEEKS